MSEHLHQSLSHLMDNEADELELRRLLKTCDEQDDDDLADTWHRYHLVRSVLHRELEQEQLFDISGRVTAALEQEPLPVSTVTALEHWRSRLGQLSETWAAKGAIAASVALAVVMLLPNPESPVVGQPVAMQAPAYQQTLPARGLQQSPLGVQRVSVGSGVEGYRLVDNQKLRQERLIQGYLMQHSEYVAASGTHGMMPMARVSGYQAAGQQ